MDPTSKLAMMPTMERVLVYIAWGGIPTAT